MEKNHAVKPPKPSFIDWFISTPQGWFSLAGTRHGLFVVIVFVSLIVTVFGFYNDYFKKAFRKKTVNFISEFSVGGADTMIDLEIRAAWPWSQRAVLCCTCVCQGRISQNCPLQRIITIYRRRSHKCKQ